MSTILLPLESALQDTGYPPDRDYFNNTVYFAFDDTTEEYIYWSWIKVPEDYSSSPALRGEFSMLSATSGNVVMGCSVMAQTAGDSADIDTTSFDTQNTSTATAVAGTAGYTTEFTITLSNDDSMAAGDIVRFKFSRVSGSGSDTASGDLELRALNFEYTSS